MKRKILYFINPVSGRRRKRSLEEIITEKTQEQNIPFEILLTAKDGTYSFLREKIKHERISDVVICGGDGTVSQIVSSLIKVDVNIGIIPLGSGNGLALVANISRNLNRALKIIFKGQSSFVDAFLINKKFSCMLCGIGFDAKVAHDFSKRKRRGLGTYINETLKNFVTASPYKFEIILKERSFSTDAFFISIANSNQFGNNFTIAPQASIDDGLLDVIIVKKMSKMRMLWAVLKQIRAGEVRHSEERNFHKKEVLYFQTDQLTINNPKMAPLHIDGEPAKTAKKFEIQIIPAAFKLIQPLS